MATLADAVYDDVAAGIAPTIAPGTYELTDAKPGLVFELFDDITVDLTGVILKPTENVTTAITVSGGEQFTGGANRRLEATGTVVQGTTQLTCHYITGQPCASFASTSQKFRPASLFTLADATGFTLCYWIWGELPASSGEIFLKDDGVTDREMFIQILGGAPDFWVTGGVTAAAGGAARIQTATNCENGLWNFVSVYFSQTGNQMGVSINGAAFTTLATTGTLAVPATPEPFDIGSRVVKMQNVWLWKGRVLNISEVQAIYASGVGQRYTDLSAGQKTGLLHAWELSEAAGATRNDSHGTNHLAEVSGPIAQDKDGWTGTVDRPLTDIMAEGDRVQLRLGVQLYDPQEPKYTIYRGITDITGNAITFDEGFPFACTVYADSAEMLGLGGDPEKVGIWGGDGEVDHIGPFGSANSFGYYQRGWGNSHDIVIFESGAPQSGLTIKNLEVDWGLSTHTQVANCLYIGNAENVRFENLTQRSFRGNGILFSQCNNSGVDGYTLRGNARAANFGPGSFYSTYLFALYGGTNIYCRNVDAVGQGMMMFGGESGSIDAVVENVHLTGGTVVAGQTWFGQHFGSYVTHFQTGQDETAGVAFRNIYLDIPTGSSTCVPSTTNGFTITNLAFAGGEIPDYFPVHYLEGYVRVGSRIFGPRTTLSHPFTVNFAGGTNQIATMPTGLYRRYPVLTIASRAGLTSITPASVNLLTTNPAPDLTLSFENEGGDGNMQRWRTMFIGSLATYLGYHKITFDPTDSSTFSLNCTLDCEYFPEVTNDGGPRFGIGLTPGSVAPLLDINGVRITL